MQLGYTLPMSWHENKRIVVGVSGGIAAYKSPTLVRRLVQRGCQVRVVMSRAATEFITPLTMQAVSGHPVHQHLLAAEAEAGMGHIELARWAEQIIIAPATANCLANLAQGRSDDLLSAVVLASAAEVVVAPAMNQQMWQHPATQRNLTALADNGVRVLAPMAGAQACGETGPGRMLEPEDIATLLVGAAPPRLLAGVAALITAGPTWEALDPVRGLTNRSSGKMGYAMAMAARDFGAQVTLISGPVSLETPRRVKRIDVSSARQMLEAVSAYASQSQWFIAVAAVADYRPATVAAHKIKKPAATAAAAKASQRMSLELVKNPDILAAVASLRKAPFSIGFAAETEHTLANARQKLMNKGVDMIAANYVGERAAKATDSGAHVFGGDENAVTLLYKSERGGRAEPAIQQVALAKTDKYQLAVQIIEHGAPLFARKAKAVKSAAK